MEYAKEAETIKLNVQNQTLDAEKTKCLEYMDKYNQEKKKTVSMKEQLGVLNEQVSKIKERFDKESNEMQNIL